METLGGGTLTINRSDIGDMVATAKEDGFGKVVTDTLTRYARTFAADNAILSMHFTRDSFRDAFLERGSSYGAACANAEHLFGLLVAVKGNAVARRMAAQARAAGVNAKARELSAVEQARARQGRDIVSGDFL